MRDHVDTSGIQTAPGRAVALFEPCCSLPLNSSRRCLTLLSSSDVPKRWPRAVPSRCHGLSRVMSIERPRSTERSTEASRRLSISIAVIQQSNELRSAASPTRSPGLVSPLR